MQLGRHALARHISTASFTLALSCGGEVDYVTAIASSNSGGTSSTTTYPGSSGGSASTGGSTSILDDCNGMFQFEIERCGMGSPQQIEVEQSCDIPLNQSPDDVSAVNIAVDCQAVQMVPYNDTDAGNVSGFVIDYSWSPAHLILLGASCAQVQVPGVHYVYVILGCIAP